MKFVRRIGKILLYLLIVVLLVFSIVAVVIQFPSVQTRLTQKVTEIIGEQLKTEVKVGAVDIDFFKTVVLEDIFIADQQNDTLLHAEQLGVDIGVFDLFQSEIYLNKIKLENACAYLYRDQRDGVFNYQFVVDNFTSTSPADTAAAAPWTLGIGKTILKNVRFNMCDEGNGGFDLKTNITDWSITADELDFEKQFIKLSQVTLSDSEVIYRLLEKDSSIVLSPPKNAKLTFPGFGWIISADKIRLENNHLVYHDDNADMEEGALDYSHLDLQTLQLSINDFRYTDEGILMEINSASFTDKNGFKLNELGGEIAILPNKIFAKNFILKTPNSHFKNNTHLTFNEFNDLSDFLNKIKLESDFTESYLAVDDLLMIAPQLRKVPNLTFPEGEQLKIKGTLQLQNNHLNLQGFSFFIGETTALQASGSIGQITSGPQFDLNIEKLAASYRSISQFTKGLELPIGLENFGQFRLSGKIKGTLGDLQANDLSLTTEATTHFAGNLKIKGLPDVNSAVFNLKINDLTTRSADLKGFSETPLPPELDSLGLIQFTGNFNGTIRDFVIDGGFHTGAGNATADLKINFNQGYTDAIYNGELMLENVDLGKILADTSQFGEVSLSTKLDGQGLTLDSLNTTLNGVVKKAVFNKYEYHDLQVDGHLAQRLFEGKMSMQDSNLNFDLKGKVNLNDSLSDVDAIVRIDTINLKSLNLYKENIGLSGVVEAKLKGSNLNNLDGKATLTNFTVSSDEKTYFDEKIILEAKQFSGGRQALAFDADFLKANMEGQYNFADLPDLVLGYVNEFFPVEELAVRPDSSLTSESPKADQQLDFDFRFTDLASLISVFLPDLQGIDALAFLRGKFDSREQQLELLAEFPALVYQNTEFDSLTLKLSGNRKRLMSDVALQNLNYNNTFYAPFLDFKIRADGDTLGFGLTVQNDSLENIFKWGGRLTELPTDYLLSFDEKLILNEEVWKVDRHNQLLFSHNSFSVSDLAFLKNEQSISVNSMGEVSLDDFAPIKLRFNNFNLKEVSALLNNPSLQLLGDLDGQFTIKEPRHNLHYNADLQVANLVLNEQLLGDLNLDASQPRGQQVVNLLAHLKGENQMTLTGFYDVPQNQFDLRADIGKLSMVVADPFLSDLMRDSRGYVSGNFTLKGTPNAPALNGKITTHDISTHVILAGTRYRTSENTITISESKINLGQFILFDPAGRKAEVSGELKHKYFENIKLDLQALSDGLNILNTTRKDNPLYYGRLFTSANVRISGTPELPKLDVVATTQDSSSLHVEPLTADLAVVQEDYVIFANPNDYEPDSLSLLEQRVGANNPGLDLALTLTVTPAASLNIIIDPLTGDELFCTGSGNFTVKMNPTGDLDITGTYVIEQGKYSFAYEGLVKRNFEIRKGSSLSFAGDPYNARFNITAVYKTRATTYELISNEATLSDAILVTSQRRTDVEVLMSIGGDLTEPIITFDIVLPQSQSGAADNLVERKLDDLRGEPTELNKQVFGLLFFNSFIQSETGAGLSNVGENAALKSVSGLISNQLNRLANRFIKGVDLTLGFESYQTGGQEASNVSELQVGLSKQLFNDRLTIQVGGNFNLENSQQSALESSGYSAIAGDFVLEYKLNEHGNYLLKVFHKSDYNALLGANSNKTGVGLMYRKSY